MAENPNYKELLQVLNEFEVEYLIVGGFAVMKDGEPRYTKEPRCLGDKPEKMRTQQISKQDVEHFPPS